MQCSSDDTHAYRVQALDLSLLQTTVNLVADYDFGLGLDQSLLGGKGATLSLAQQRATSREQFGAQ